MGDSSMKTYKSIKEFVSSLNDCYGEDFHNIKLYNELLQKITMSHTEAMKKHNHIFREFCLANEICILNKNYNLVESKILFSDNIFINLSEILDMCDNSEKGVIWKHIAYIYSFFKPNNHIKNMLTKKEETNETNFLKDMINKVEDSIDGGNVNNPMEAITKMMTSGVFGELVGNMTNGLQSGDLNIGNLLGSVNDMVGTMNADMPQSQPQSQPQSSPNKRNRKKKKPRRK